MFDTIDRFEAFICDFEACKLTQARWTHHAHLAVGFWYLLHHTPAEALNVVRERIKYSNEAMGKANTETGGYHETITRAYLGAIQDYLEQNKNRPTLETLILLLASPLGSNEWPLKYYSRDRLFSVQARKAWVEPDLLPLPGSAFFN
jgi:hypothetical protein